jgi:hypothetical protein
MLVNLLEDSKFLCKQLFSVRCGKNESSPPIVVGEDPTAWSNVFIGTAGDVGSNECNLDDQGCK